MMKIILVFFAILTIIISLESIPAFKANEDYIQTGSLQIDQNFLIKSQQIETTSIIPLLFRKPKSTNYSIAATLQNLNIIFSPKISFKILASPSSSTAGQISITWGVNCSISRLKIRYITVIDNIKYLIQFSSLNLGRFPNTKMFFAGNSQNKLALINGIKILNSINITYFDISLSFPINDYLRVSTISNIPTQYEDFSVILISYETTETNMPFLRVQRASISLNMITSASYSNIDNSMTQLNTFWGLNRLGVQLNQTQFQISSDLENFTVNAKTNQNLRANQFTGLVFLFKECDLQTPYYLQSNNTCYDHCPIRTVKYLNNRCIKCSYYDCFNCQQQNDGNVCIQCSSTLDFRVLNNITKRCDPLLGYYDDGTDNPIAQKCDGNCRSCNINATKCTSCNNEFVLNGDINKCEACPAKCSICTSRVVCTICRPQYKLINGQCQIQKSSNVTVVASAATSLISCCALVAIFVFHKQNKQWNINIEQQQQNKQAGSGNGNDVKKVVSTIIENPSSNLVVMNNSKMESGQQSGYVVYQRSKRRRRG